MLYAGVTSSEVLSLDQEKYHVGDIRNAYDEDTFSWKYGLDEIPVITSKVQEPELLPSPPPANWKSRLTVQVKSLLTADEMPENLPRQLGLLLHDALARLTHPSRIDAVIMQMTQLGLITPSQQAQVGSVLKDITDHTILEGWKNGKFSRLSEREIINNSSEIRRPDLVLYNDSETLVVDFKFTDERTSHHRYEKQVQEYMGLLKQTGFKNIKGYLLYAGEEIEIVSVA